MLSAGWQRDGMLEMRQRGGRDACDENGPLARRRREEQAREGDEDGRSRREAGEAMQRSRQARSVDLFESR